MQTVAINGQRSLYVYLLDYGWPDGEWEQLFKRHFMRLADRASKAEAVVIGSMNGIHFGNEVLSWHRVADLDADDVLPGILLTKTHPNYFVESNGDEGEKPAAPGLEDLLVIPLKPFCKDETDFLRTIEGVFADLQSGLELQNFEIAKHDLRRQRVGELGRRVVRAIELKPGAFGFAVDLKALLMPSKAI